MTSQRGRVVTINQRTPTLTMATDDGRRVVLKGDALDQNHLDYGYALTVHREQGATADRSHYLAEGGGRELAYVAMSRARGPSIVHAVADDLGQAIEDITHDWSLDRNQHWITRTATALGVDPSIRALPVDPDARRARLLAELDRLERHAPPDVTAELAAARADLDRMPRSRDDLVRGAGRWHHTPAGQAARDLEQARRQRQHAEDRLDLPTTHGASDIGGAASPRRRPNQGAGPAGLDRPRAASRRPARPQDHPSRAPRRRTRDRCPVPSAVAR